VSEEVAARIRDAIRDHGPIAFDEFMEHALYGPGGFYEEPPVGRDGHFITSPHVHPVFGALLASGLRAAWGQLGRPDPFPLVEVGAGDGTLARQLLEALIDVPVRYAAVERSSGGRARLAELPIRVASRLDEPVENGCLVANELLDNLPFRWVRGAAAGPVEVRIDLSGNRLIRVDTPCDDDLAALAPSLGPGEEAAVPIGALSFLDDVASVLGRGYAVLIDYGDTAGGSPGGIHGYRDHGVIEDVLDDPGSADITAGVDFAELVRRALARGLAVRGPVTQRDALLSLGFRTWTEQERRRQADLMASGAGAEAARIWGGRSRASLLVDPAGLGHLRWLLLATPGLAWPAWANTGRKP